MTHGILLKTDIPKSIVMLLLCLSITACASLTGTMPLTEKDGKAVPLLGVRSRPAPNLNSLPGVDVPHGLKVAHVMGGSAAHKAGIRTGDIIIGYDGISMGSLKERDLLSSFGGYIKKGKSVGDDIALRIIRIETVYRGVKDTEGMAILKKTELDRLLERQVPGERIEVTVQKDVHIIDVVATLGPSTLFAGEAPPENSTLFPSYEALTDPYTDLSRRIITDFHLDAACGDLLDRYRDDEAKSDAFRLDLFRYIHRDPFKFHLVADMLSRDIEARAAEKDFNGLMRRLSDMLDAPIEETAAHLCPTSRSPQDHLSYIRKTIDDALLYRRHAFRNLDGNDLTFLREELPLLTDRGFETDPDDESREEEGTRALRLLRAIDYSALMQSAAALNRLADPRWLELCRESMNALDPGKTLTAQGVKGTILHREETSAGLLIIGGKGDNRYSAPIPVIIDLGGDDLYASGAGAADNNTPLSICIDFSGNDEYSSTEDFSQGAGVTGVGLLIDSEGDDLYQGINFSQGTGMAGAGMFIDYRGNDRYFGQEYNQGVAFWGLGLFMDFAGDDSYRSHLTAQGVGGPGGMGLLYDGGGDDSYYATGREPSSYGTPGMFSGYSQGFGIGFRGHASGGIGMLIDAGGHDRYRAGNFSQGGGYYFGLGLLRSGGNGDDRYVGSRYGQGFSAHSAAGILIDDGGNDRYAGLVGALQSAAWDLGLAALVDKAGDDVYDSEGLFFSQGAAAHNGFSLFIDMAGRDVYRWNEEGIISRNDYHGGSSLSVRIDDGGAVDRYNGDRAGNNRISAGDAYGIVVDLDRPVAEALAEEGFRKLYVR